MCHLLDEKRERERLGKSHTHTHTLLHLTLAVEIEMRTKEETMLGFSAVLNVGTTFIKLISFSLFLSLLPLQLFYLVLLL